MKLSRFRAFLLGLRDGYREPYDLGSGITFGDDRDEVQGRGVNIGQSLGRILRRLPLIYKGG